MAEVSSTPRKVAILFAGGPAPAANAVISSAALAFLRNGIEVVGIQHGYSAFEAFGPESPLVEGQHYVNLDLAAVRRKRNAQGIMIGTARTNPGKKVTSLADLTDAAKSAPLRQTYDALRSLGVDALVSIGGDDTLKTANKLKLFQDQLPTDAPRIPVVHLPKTIDNDYCGIDFTFGYFTAVDNLATELRNLLYDAEANRAYFVAECMGRSAGWLSYGAAIAGEASLVLSVEDIAGELQTTETTVNEETGKSETRRIMDGEKVLDRIMSTILAREKEGKEYGVLVLAEGLVTLLPSEYLEGVPRDDHGHIKISQIQLYDLMCRLLAERYEKATGKQRLFKGLQLGYEARCAQPTAFDAIMGSQLGFGAYRALAEEHRNGVMVSIAGQMELIFVEFEKLVDPQTLVTMVRHIEPDSDFHRLARILET